MPTFPTPEPITARVEAAAGSVRLVATDRTDTVVAIHPCDECRDADIRAAEQARLDYANGTLAVAAGKWGFFGARTGAVDIVVELPSRSRLHAEVASVDVHADGRFTDVRFSSASGDLTIQSISGAAKISTASGGATVGDLDGDLKFQTASGALSVQRLRGNMKAQSASGSVGITAAIGGSVSAQTSSGDVEVGIAAGTAARLDLLTGSGVVTNRLTPSDGPAEGDETVLIHTRTGSGDVDVHRSLEARGTISG
jgi:DUF4097 and DUF4098 domain-containing protein YvlB